jgi:hypothetical protein
VPRFEVARKPTVVDIVDKISQRIKSPKKPRERKSRWAPDRPSVSGPGVGGSNPPTSHGVCGTRRQSTMLNSPSERRTQNRTIAAVTGRQVFEREMRVRVRHHADLGVAVEVVRNERQRQALGDRYRGRADWRRLWSRNFGPSRRSSSLRGADQAEHSA